MKYDPTESGIILHDTDCFDITAILECGQCFRFHKLADKHYRIIAYGKALYVRQDGNAVELYPCSLKEFEEVWLDYFDLKTDYSAIKSELSKVGGVMEEAVKTSPGIRHLCQEPFECLISFIISQNNRIPMIMKSVENISVKYGSKIENKYGDYYAFPTPEQLLSADIAGLMECRVGFRARYIIDAVQKTLSGEIDLNRNNMLTTSELRENLKKITGVGDKVADCVMLFSYGRREVFPTDVWIIRVMSRYFFDNAKISKKEIHSLAYEKLGRYAGMANQYLFHYIRLLEQKVSINMEQTKDRQRKQK